MKKLLSLLLLLVLCFFLVACDSPCKDGHQWEDATCEKPKTCAVCGKIEGEPLEHTVNTYETILAPTCTVSGKQQGLCSLCGEMISKEVDKIAHIDDNTWIVIKNPTDSSLGEKATHCTVCGEIVQTSTFDLSMEEKNAIKKAESYLSLMAFSRSGLINQLEYEGFSNSAATSAVDSIVVDWNEQAAKKAESYLSLMAFSRSGLIDQLKYEGFSNEQAEYGVTAVGY